MQPGAGWSIGGQAPSTKRRIDLYLTPEGRKMARLTLGHLRAVHARIVAGLSAPEARALQRLLLRAHENLKAR